MKGVKGRILKKLKSIPPQIPGFYLKQQASNGQDGLLSDLLQPLDPNRVLRDLFVQEGDTRKSAVNKDPPTIVIDVSESESEWEEEDDQDEKENARPQSPQSAFVHQQKKLKENPPETPTGKGSTQISDLDVSSFRRPRLNSSTLFDPDLLAAFREAVADYYDAARAYEEAQATARAAKLKKEEEEGDPGCGEESPSENPLLEFEERCPPGGSEAVVLYTTSLRGIRKTFEDCTRLRFLLGSLRIVFFERDVSMHLEFREELWKVLGGGRVIPPRLFIRGRYIGGADQVLGLHERGKLMPLLQGLPLGQAGSTPCAGCGGFLFVPCSECHGSCKLRPQDVDDDGAGGCVVMSVRCGRCNENGLVVCPLCSSSSCC